MEHKIELMGHIVAGYPSVDICVKAGAGILRGGANFLEVQFPFSDGNADGVLIQNASDYSIKHGFEPRHGFVILKELCKSNKHILAMTYANIILNYGVENFVKEAKNAGAFGFIVPDFCFGEEDFGLRNLCYENNLHFIELIAPLTPTKRVREIANTTKSPFIYLIARNGITGATTALNESALKYIESVNNICKLENKEIMLGFGINDSVQVASLRGKIYGVVVGSYFVNAINKNAKSSDITKSLQDATQTLLSHRI